jgi:hypothetical protein
MKTFNIYPNKVLTFGNEKYKIEPYRVAEIRDYIVPLENIQNTLNNLQSKLDLYQKEELTFEILDKLTEMDREATDLKAELNEKLFALAQLALKRTKYPEAYNKIGSELNDFPDIGISESQAGKVVNIMMTLANKEMPKMKDADTKNEVKERLQRKSGKDITNG